MVLACASSFCSDSLKDFYDIYEVAALKWKASTRERARGGQVGAQWERGRRPQRCSPGTLHSRARPPRQPPCGDAGLWLSAFSFYDVR